MLASSDQWIYLDCIRLFCLFMLFRQDNVARVNTNNNLNCLNSNSDKRNTILSLRMHSGFHYIFHSHFVSTQTRQIFISISCCNNNGQKNAPICFNCAPNYKPLVVQKKVVEVIKGTQWHTRGRHTHTHAHREFREMRPIKPKTKTKNKNQQLKILEKRE